VRKLIDHTAGAVATYDWEFEKLLMERERGNPKFDFMKTAEAAIPGEGVKGPPEYGRSCDYGEKVSMIAYYS